MHDPGLPQILEENGSRFTIQPQITSILKGLYVAGNGL